MKRTIELRFEIETTDYDEMRAPGTDTQDAIIERVREMVDGNVDFPNVVLITCEGAEVEHHRNF